VYEQAAVQASDAPALAELLQGLAAA
jgi:hypothetical protein